jgi:hypothetical protein
MAKTWDEMSVPEKCEALRGDVEKAFNALYVLGTEAKATNARLRAVEAAVERVESGKKQSAWRAFALPS